MTVIKAADAAARRATLPDLRGLAELAWAPAPTLAEIEFSAREQALEAEIARLLERAEAAEAQAAALADDLAEREAALAEAQARSAGAEADAEARGRAAGLEAGSAAKADLLARLEEATAHALDLLRDDLRGTETLAVALAKAALARVFGDDREMAARVVRLIRRQLEGLERAAVLRVEVSAQDFADPDALDDLTRQGGLEGIEAKALEELSPGDCRLRLRLGELDIGLGQQWARLSGLLDDALAVEPVR